MRPRTPSPSTEGEPGMRGIWLGILAYRWATFAYMVVAAVLIRSHLRYPGWAVATVLLTLGWNMWLTVTSGWRRPLDRWIDLAWAVALLPISGLVMDEGAIDRGVLFFATAFPSTAALTVGAGFGVVAGLSAGVVLSLGLLASRAANGLVPQELSFEQWTDLVNGAFYYLAAGGAAGVVRRALLRAEAERSLAEEEAGRQRERAARLAERDALGRQIHDSVLQALALVGKRGKELVGRTSLRGEDIGELVELTGRQERALRELLSGPPEEPVAGMVSLRTVLHAAAFEVGGVLVTITTAGSVWLPADDGEELTSAIRQALDNVVQHAHTSRATVFAESERGQVVISIRDDGVGFDYDESRLAREGKLGMLKSMKGRIEGLGGVMLVHSAVGHGTEVEFRLPVEERSGRSP